MFLSEQHKRLYDTCIRKDETNPRDNERKALFYILSGSEDLVSKGIDAFYDFEEQAINAEALETVDLSSGSKALVLLAYNLYNNYRPERPLTVLETFTRLDEKNTQIALNAIKLRLDLL